MIVPDKLTPLTRDEATRALLTAYKQLTGALPSTAVLALLVAQSAFETGHWKSLHHYNFGNAKAGLSYPLITQFRCSEVDAQGVDLPGADLRTGQQALLEREFKTVGHRRSSAS